MKKFLKLTAFVFLFGITSANSQEIGSQQSYDDLEQVAVQLEKANIDPQQIDAQQVADNLNQLGEQLEEDFDNLGDQLSQKMGEAIETSVNAFTSAIGAFTDAFAQIQVMTETCTEEDSKNPSSQKQFEDIVSLIVPEYANNFSVTLNEQTPPESKATGKFSANNIDFDLTIQKSSCLLLMEDIAETFDSITHKTKEAVAEKISSIEQQNNIQQPSSPSYTIAGNDIPADKFNHSVINNFDVLQYNDPDTKDVYTIAFIGTLGLNLKAHGNNADYAVNNLLQSINIPALQQIIGSETSSEIKKRLHKEIENKLANNVVSMNADRNSDQIKYEIIKKETDALNITPDKLNQIKNIFTDIISSLDEHDSSDTCEIFEEFGNIYCNLHQSKQWTDEEGFHSTTHSTMHLELNVDYRYLFTKRWEFFYAEPTTSKIINGFDVTIGQSKDDKTYYETNLTNALQLGIQCYKGQPCSAEEVIKHLNKKDLLQITGEDGTKTPADIIKNINDQLERELNGKQ